jgi:hypothetical protein
MPGGTLNCNPLNPWDNFARLLLLLLLTLLLLLLTLLPLLLLGHAGSLKGGGLEGSLANRLSP